jgi:cytochrome c biogenesis protein CcmG/thiol:disulfide interchange protein DsbE
LKLKVLGSRLSALGVLAWLAACGERGSSRSRVDVGLAVPAYSAVTLAGDSTTLQAQQGKVVLLNVWATWCHPCRAEIPELEALHHKYQGRGLHLVGVSVDAAGAQADIRDFMREFPMSYSIWLDPEERVSTQFLIFGVPSTFLIDKQGILRWRHTGPIRKGDTTLTTALERLLGG